MSATDPARLTPGERYQRDATFHWLVDTMRSALEAAEYTPTELREAVILAATIHEQTAVRSILLDESVVDRATWLPSFLRRVATEQRPATG